MSFAAKAAQMAGHTALALGWRPDEFWNATPAELSAVLNAVTRPVNDVADASELSALMQQFPDAPSGGD